MDKSIQTLFQQPAYWALFDGLTKALDQQDDLRIDPVALMERIGPHFIRHAEAMTPRRIIKPLDGTKNDRRVSHYVFCTGRGKTGPYGYRVFSIEHAYTNAKLQYMPHHIGVLDSRRPLDNSELLGKNASDATLFNNFQARMVAQGGERFKKFLTPALSWLEADNAYDARFETTFENHNRLDRLFKRLKSSAQWAHQLGFLDSPAQTFRQSHALNRGFVADDMLRAVDDLIAYDFETIKANIKAGLRPLIVKALERFDALALQGIEAMADDAKAQLDGEALDLLRQNPSALTVRNYTLLTSGKISESEFHTRLQGARSVGQPHLSQEAQSWRMLASRVPIVLLIGDHGITSTLMRKWAFGGYDDAPIFQYLFGTTTPERIAHYKALRESDVGTDNLKKLRSLAHTLEQLGTSIPIPKTPHAWSNLGALHEASQGIARIIDQPAQKILSDLLTEKTAAIAHYFNGASQNSTMAVRDLQMLKNRIVASALAPKLYVEAQGRIPVTHIFYMLSGYDLVDKNSIHNSIPQRTRRTIDNFNAGPVFLATLFNDVSTTELLGRAFDFSTHRHDWDAKLRELIFTNRLYEHGALYGFAPLPAITVKEDDYSFVPLRNQADLFKECDETGGDMWRLGKRALHEGLHFISIRKNGGHIYATACIKEPENFNAPWTLQSIETPDSLRLNHTFRDVIALYLEHPQFLDFVHFISFDTARAKLRKTLTSQAKDTELMGFKVGNADERRTMLQALAPYIKTHEKWDIDHNGCLSSPRIDSITAALLEAVMPHYGTPKPA